MRGREAVLDYWREIQQAWAGLDIEFVHVIDPATTSSPSCARQHAAGTATSMFAPVPPWSSRFATEGLSR
jgi:hypothetical protein